MSVFKPGQVLKADDLNKLVSWIRGPAPLDLSVAHPSRARLVCRVINGTSSLLPMYSAVSLSSCEPGNGRKAEPVLVAQAPAAGSVYAVLLDAARPGRSVLACIVGLSWVRNSDAGYFNSVVCASTDFSLVVVGNGGGGGVSGESNWYFTCER